MRERLLPGLLLVCLLFGAVPAAAEEDAERFDNSVYPAAFRVRVNDEIRRGVKALRKAQRPDGRFAVSPRYPLGATALWALTMLKCGVRADDPQIVKAFAFMRTQPLERTYSVALLLMAIEARYAPARDPFQVEDPDRYAPSAHADPCENGISSQDRAWMRKGVVWLLAQQQANGLWRYPAGGYDLSNTQFALLGLHAATRCGKTVKRQVWLDALEAILAQQEQSGAAIEYRANEVRGRYRFEWIERAVTRGFGYVAGRTPTGSMSTAGLTALIICQNRLWRSRAFTGRLRVATRRGVRDCMAWLQHHFSVTTNPGGRGTWHRYYLYGLERCGILGRYRFLGLHDWYAEGAEQLLRSGAARRRNVDACFALLFLKRATSRMNAPVITPSGGPGKAPATMPETALPRWARKLDKQPEGRLAAIGYWVKQLGSEDPQAVFRATIKLGHLGNRLAVRPLVRTLESHADPYARIGAAVALARLGACNAVEPLIEALADADDLVRHAANQALIRITRYTKLRYLSAMRADARTRLRKAWRTWWAANEAALRKALGQPRRGT